MQTGLLSSQIPAALVGATAARYVLSCDMMMKSDAWADRLATLAVATADASDEGIDRAVRDVLGLVREVLGMEVAFISHFRNGQRVFRAVDASDGAQVISEGSSDPLDQSFCQRVIDGRMPELVRDVSKLADFGQLPATPFRIGAHLSTPIVLADGSLYGTLCCFSFSPAESLVARDLKRLRMAAGMLSRLIDAENATRR